MKRSLSVAGFRLSVCAVMFVLPSVVQAQAAKSAHKPTQSETISADDRELFEGAAEKYIKSKGVPECGETYNVDEGVVKALALGKLGQGITLYMQGSCACARGQCPIALFLKVGGRYRVAIDEIGWDARVKEGNRAIPDVNVHFQGWRIPAVSTERNDLSISKWEICRY